jgi:hypothetical protein
MFQERPALPCDFAQKSAQKSAQKLQGIGINRTRNSNEFDNIQATLARSRRIRILITMMFERIVATRSLNRCH